MGAPTSNSNRKRSYYFSGNSESRFDLLHVLKKPKISTIMNLNVEKPVVVSSSITQKSFFDRMKRYPEVTKTITRVIHAPVQKHNKSSDRKVMEDFDLYKDLEQKKKLAFGSLKYVGKEKEVIDVEKDEDVVEVEEILDDSGVEEVEILGDRRSKERDSVVLNQRSVESIEDDVYIRERYEKFAENRLQGSSSVASDLSNQTPQVDGGGNILTNFSLNRGVKEVSEPPHKKLYTEAVKRDSKISQIKFKIGLLTKKLSFFSRPVKKPEEEVLPREPFVALTSGEEDEVTRALSNANRRKLLVTHPDSNIEITGEVLQCLRHGAWLNDEVINLYLELLKEREKRDPKRFLKCHFFSTFFYKKLITGKSGYDFKAVRRWTTQRKIGYGLIECDKIFVPIHKEVHWCLAIINKKDQKFQYLDSLKGRDSKVLNILARYYVDEVKDKSAKDIDVSSWKHEYVDDLPAQENGWDCGMFMIKYADFYSRGLGLCFNQENMPYFRKRTVKEILRLKAD
ncbi:Ubiquitin-like-specific protease esd4 [Thalictrum thalictroides]|uniref:Ubiquitin-like-specific protease esd4 n=1 Tax=Thalictrum thalictroides TaxID=46969 RepID=A0A7J6URT1_THATH|nr:Ubiquitin-like-specific protease esd4 [Thalictrum thalictroides]